MKYFRRGTNVRSTGKSIEARGGNGKKTREKNLTGNGKRGKRDKIVFVRDGREKT